MTLRRRAPAALALLACAACCAVLLPVLAGLLTGMGAVTTGHVVLSAAGLLVSAMTIWYLRRRRRTCSASCGC